MVRGFTLIELVIVIVVLSIVGALAIPARSGATRDYRVRLAEARISADLTYLQRASWHASTQCGLSFSNDEYVIRKSTVRADDTTVSLSDSPYRLRIDSVDFGDGGDGVTFADGVPVLGALGKILFSVSGQPWRARVACAAGTVESAPQ